MKVTFPHMGNMFISIKVLLETSGIEYVMPPLSNKKTLEPGIMHSPEFACMPFKTILGDFIYGVENGAGFILMGGGCGQCRLGYYGDLHAEILRSLGYNVELVCLDVNSISFGELLKKLKPLTEGKRPLNILKGILYAIRTTLMVDRLDLLAGYTRCREIKRGETDRLMKHFYNSIHKAKGFRGVKQLILSARKRLKQIPIDSKMNPLKVAIVGEIYTAIHPDVNFEIEKKLGNMGVEIVNKLSVSHWIIEHILKGIMPFKIKSKPHEAGKEFMNTDDIGGHGLETIGNSILSGLKGYDGVIQIYPFTCMPEIIAQSTFGELQKKYGIPIMTLIVDEMTGEAGYMTRIEAFIDMLERRRTAGSTDVQFC